jgi:hypothetical protein
VLAISRVPSHPQTVHRCGAGGIPDRRTARVLPRLAEPAGDDRGGLAFRTGRRAKRGR